jgi:hypothetical protein
MPRGRQPEGQAALSNAERQARWRARRQVPPPSLTIKSARPARRSRTKHWNDALAEMGAVQAEYAAWSEAWPESLRDSATAIALQDMIDLDLDAIAAVQPPLGYGRDCFARHDRPKRGAARGPRQIVGPRHARPRSGGGAWLRSRRKRRICHGSHAPLEQCRVGTKEQVL